jgi:small subunit ribosomal protein S16
MPVVIRMARAGAKNRPFFHIVAADKTAARDGRYLERLGTYNPKIKGEGRVVVDQEAVTAWLKKGAIPSETVGHLLKSAAKSK